MFTHDVTLTAAMFVVMLQVGISLLDFQLEVHVFHLQQDGAAQEELDDEDLAAANHWILPSADFDHLWESLIFDANIKKQVRVASSHCDSVIFNYGRILFFLAASSVCEHYVAVLRQSC